MRLIKIGNSRGIRLPKPIIEEAGLEQEVELRIRDGMVVITSAKRPRAGWNTAAKQMRARDEDRLLDEPVSTRFDEEDWRW